MKRFASIVFSFFLFSLQAYTETQYHNRLEQMKGQGDWTDYKTDPTCPFGEFCGDAFLKKEAAAEAGAPCIIPRSVWQSSTYKKTTAPRIDREIEAWKKDQLSNGRYKQNYFPNSTQRDGKTEPHNPQGYSKLIIHHAAGPVSGGGPHSIYQMHAVRNGWTDIGYHYLLVKVSTLASSSSERKRLLQNGIGQDCASKKDSDWVVVEARSPSVVGSHVGRPRIKQGPGVNKFINVRAGEYNNLPLHYSADENTIRSSRGNASIHMQHHPEFFRKGSSHLYARPLYVEPNTNRGNLGIMLAGNWENNQPPREAKEKLKKFTRFVVDSGYYGPIKEIRTHGTGKTRELLGSKACPGEACYNWMLNDPYMRSLMKVY